MAHALRRTANEFAGSLTDLLNGTVCEGARVTTYHRDPGYATLGTALNRAGRCQPVPLRPKGRSRPGLFIWMSMFLDSDGHLTVDQSVCALTGGAAGTDYILHYDFDRGKTGYAEAHLQVNAYNESLTALLADCGRPKATLGKLHLPVGGRRFRPSIEDVVEFLLDERLVDAKPDARAVLERSRTKYHHAQLRAAIRSHSDLSVDVH